MLPCLYATRHVGTIAAAAARRCSSGTAA
jgi:hypothetical protein